MVIVSIHQPNYIPWIGYFDKMSKSDVFVFLDSVEYSRGSVINRNKIRNATGWNWLTIPVNNKDTSKPICEVRFADTKWWKKHYTSLVGAYSKCEYFEEYFPYFSQLYNEQQYSTIADLNIDIIQYLAESFSIDVKFIRSSEMNIDSSLQKNELLIDILQKLNADVYISGTGSKDYMDEAMFQENGISVIYNSFKPFIYRQRWGGFEPYMSSVDLLFNEGSWNFRKD